VGAREWKFRGRKLTNPAISQAVSVGIFYTGPKQLDQSKNHQQPALKPVIIQNNIHNHIKDLSPPFFAEKPLCFSAQKSIKYMIQIN
jgi:hypothetical protein